MWVLTKSSLTNSRKPQSTLVPHLKRKGLIEFTVARKSRRRLYFTKFLPGPHHYPDPHSQTMWAESSHLIAGVEQLKSVRQSDRTDHASTAPAAPKSQELPPYLLTDPSWLCFCLLGWEEWGCRCSGLSGRPQTLSARLMLLLVFCVPVL
jgi:hypothetical protein